MVILEYEGIEIDRCLACGGTWFDTGEFEEMVAGAGADLHTIRGFLHSTEESGATFGPCPRCRKNLKICFLGKDGSVKIERCPADHGLWVRGEVMEASLKFFHLNPAHPVIRFLTHSS